MRVLALALSLALPFGATIAVAQEQSAPQAEEQLSPEHMALAQEVIDLTDSAAAFDDILPRIAVQTQNVFTRNNPSIAREVEETVLAVALDLAPQRVELAKVIQQIWARRFTVEELEAMKSFFASSTGQKFVELTPSITALSVGAARQWEQVMSEAILEEARRRLVEQGAL